MRNLVHNLSGLPVKMQPQNIVPPQLNDAWGSEEVYATRATANSIKTACIDSRDWIDMLPRAFNDILPNVNAITPGAWTPRHDITIRFQSKLKLNDNNSQHNAFAVVDWSISPLSWSISLRIILIN
jgi:hypothetical protein